MACKVEGVSPLLLTLTGACTEMPPSKDVTSIVATVRTKETKSLSVTNKSTEDWDLKPVIEGAYFSGPDMLEVAAGSTVTYDITYYPLTMTSDTNKHLVIHCSLRLYCHHSLLFLYISFACLISFCSGSQYLSIVLCSSSSHIRHSDEYLPS